MSDGGDQAIEAEADIEGYPHPPVTMTGPTGPLLKLIRDERVAFLIVGGFNTGIGVLWYAFFYWLMHPLPFGYMSALLAAHVASVITAFLGQRYFVFRVRGHFWIDFARFEIVNLNALAFNIVALPFVHEVLGVQAFASQLIITVFTALVSYFAHKYFSFRRAKHPKSDPELAAESATAEGK
jgi:putative flippase GtrA